MNGEQKPREVYGLVPLTIERLKVFQEMVGLSDIQGLDLSRELRTKNFPLIHKCLENTLQELLSSIPPRPEEDPAAEDGLMYLFDDKCEQYLQDGINWKKSNMSVKLIVYNSANGVYKLKNHKKDVGKPVMRRQTWQAADTTWRRHEYKLIKEEIFLKPEHDGSLSVNEVSNLQNFPVLIHYFKKTAKPNTTPLGSPAPSLSTAPTPTQGLALTALPPPLSSSPPSSTSSHDGHAIKRPKLLAQNTLSLPFVSLLPPNTTTTVTAKTEIKTEPSFPLQQSPSCMLPFSPSALLPSPPTALFEKEEFDETVLFNPFEEVDLTKYDALLTQSTPVGCLTVSSEGIQILLEDPLGPQSTAPKAAPTIETNETRSAPPQAPIVGALPLLPVGPPMALISAPPSNIEIGTYAPDTGPSCQETKVILVVDAATGGNSGFYKGGNKVKYTCMSNGVELDVKVITNGIFEFYAPPNPAGIRYFWLTCKPLEGHHSPVEYTKAVAFYYTPSDESAKLSLAFCNLTQFTTSLATKFAYTVQELDVSSNYLNDFSFLSTFVHLNTLIADNNNITENTTFPYMPQLKTLYVNRNKIRDLRVFVEKVVTALPSLGYLSMLGNEACPFFSHFEEYRKYRLYVISCLRNLKHLDSTPITTEERNSAQSIASYIYAASFV